MPVALTPEKPLIDLKANCAGSAPGTSTPPVQSSSKEIEGASGRERSTLMGLEFDRLTEHEVVDEVLRDDGGGWVCPVNVDVLRQVVEDEEIRLLVEDADLVVADGMPLLWASRLQRTPLPERVAGSSLTVSLPPRAAERGRSVFLLGGNPGAADAAADALREQAPALDIAGTACPPMGFERDEAQIGELVASLRAAQPDVVFVGLGFPKQDRLIQRLRGELPRAWFISCGISFSFVAGEVRRAPEAIQRLGLEWVHRLLQEPRRLARRYLVLAPPFVARLLTSAVGVRLRRRHLEGSPG
jgi:N-acetylglucosaminyldiphosphoundecaprenol N-acetyl-beta-D-mannosaminyltransferase